MGNYSLSNKADFDLANIYEYGILNFGLKQAKKYLFALHEWLENLADNPSLGRCSKEFAPELSRFEYQTHVIFYIPTDTGIFIVRILRNNMDFKQHI